MKFLDGSLTSDNSKTHVSCNVCRYGIDFIRSGGGMPIRIFQMSWTEVEEMVIAHGRNIEGEEAYALADKVTENAV